MPGVFRCTCSVRPTSLDRHAQRASCSGYRIKGLCLRAITGSRTKIFQSASFPAAVVSILRRSAITSGSRCCPRRRALQAAVASTIADFRILAFIRRSRELGFSLDASAPCCASADPESLMRRGPGDRRPSPQGYPGQVADLKSSNASSQQRWPDVLARQHRIAPC